MRNWFHRFVCTMDSADLDLLALFTVHTHLAMECYTTPRLLLDSPVPGSGKTTTLEHLQRLCLHPVQMASLSSPALLARMLDAGLRTILIDEADRSLNPDKDGVAELIAVLNSGYKRGSTRPVLVPTKEGWNVSEMPTFAPVVMAGNSPNLPDDTKCRSVVVPTTFTSANRKLLAKLSGLVILRRWKQPGARTAWAALTRRWSRRCRR